MTLGIMQPYFFPYLGYFSLIKNTDKWIVFDTVQYIRKGWINRNRILSPSKNGYSYITVPVKSHPRKTAIKDIQIDNSGNWKERIFNQIDYYNKAAHYDEVIELLKEIFNNDWQYIKDLNIEVLRRICEYLRINFDYNVFSEDTMGIKSVNEPDEWALEISKKMGADIYINPPGGKSFFNKDKYHKNGIEIKFLKQNLLPYNCFNNFIPGLSIIDVMMFNSPEQINKMLDNYELE